MKNHIWFEQQSPIKIDRWIDFGSKEAKEICPYPEFNKMLEAQLNDPKNNPFTLDELGRIYCKGEGGVFFPLHDEFCGEKIGYRFMKRVVN